MGLMRCSRGNCERIMCDRHSNDHGYICDDCFEELTGKGVSTNIDDFMGSKKPSGNREAAETYFKSIFQECG